MNTPQILSPAGDKFSFLAAIAAGADAIYCGLKIFSARMEAHNFSIEELSALTQLARSYSVDVYVAFNSIIKESELEKVFKILCKLNQFVDLQGLIVQDPALITLAEQAGFDKEIVLSTLGNCTFPTGLKAAHKSGFQKAVLPREFTIDEIKTMAANTPGEIELEIFIHGALCYSVSGRCYWSSWFGGKSALRGRCVQPCRRMYEQKGHKKRYFSCMDFSADVLAKVLKDIPQVTTWKIEGRKKSPHYVYYTVKAYKLLRDEPKKKKQALAYLDYAMGRDFTHYNLLSHRVSSPLDHKSETGSGMFIGRVKNPQAPYFITREALIPSDLIRIGFEGDSFHEVLRVTRAVPKKGKFYFNKKYKFKIKKGTSAYLIDRREALLADAITALEKELGKIEKTVVKSNKGKLSRSYKNQQRSNKGVQIVDLVRGKTKFNRQKNKKGVWISGQRYSNPVVKHDWLWIDPLLFPEEEKLCSDYISKAIKKGAKNFVLNSPWQISMFKNPRKLNIWAGPFCNITNSISVDILKKQGFSGVIVSPELDKETLLSLPGKSSLPLGLVTYGNWPLAVSRILSDELKPGHVFFSPRGEAAWVSKFNNNYFLFPNWVLDLTEKEQELKKAGYALFVNIHENIPKSISMKKRPGLWNWNLKLL